MSIRDTLRDAVRSGREKWAPENASTLVAFARPDLGATPDPLRRLLEPIIAAVSLGALMALTSVAGVSFAFFMLAAGLIYLIITQVFGIQIEPR